MTRNDNTFFFQIFHLWAIVLSHQIPSFYISFAFFFYICSSPFFHPVVAASVLLSFSFFFFFLHFFTSIASSFFLSLLFSTLQVDAFKGFIVLFYGFICFWISGFCLGLCKGGRDDGRIFVHGLCVLCSGWVKGWDRWVWVVGSGRRRSGSSSGFGSGQVQQLWVSS